MNDHKYNIYRSGEYIQNNPTLHVEDTAWKLKKIVPAIDRFVQDFSFKDLKLLDVGGGAGLLLKGISDYLKEKDISVNKYALDLSKDMLQIQKTNNPDIISNFDENIESTSFRNKEMDLVLMIDVLEHVANPIGVLRELSRISKYVIFKVPMEDNLFYNFLNILKQGGLRRDIFQKVGHIQYYNFRKFRKQVVLFSGEILYCNFTNEFHYMLSKDYHKKLTIIERIVFALGSMTFVISPYLCSRLFPNSIVCLMKCK